MTVPDPHDAPRGDRTPADLGKALSARLLPLLEGGGDAAAAGLDPSTATLLERLRT
jgi:hypothetical protein